MGKYVPTAITYQDSGLVKDRDAFVLADDAYEDLENIYQWRGRLRRRQGYDELGRLRRLYSGISYFVTGASPWSFNVLTLSGYISAIDVSGDPTNVVTTTVPHGLSNGDSVVFTDVGGTKQLNYITYVIANITTTTFEVTQAGGGAFTSGGSWISDQSLFVLEPNASVECGSFSMVVDADGTAETITDDGAGILTGTLLATGTINYATGAVTITGAVAAKTTALTMGYFPGLPVMGLPKRELAAINAEQTIGFDTRYTYKYNNTSRKFDELSPPTMWSGSDSEFFYTANYWYSNNNAQYFWASNFSGTGGDPIRIYDGVIWFNFAPTVGGSTKMHQTLLMIPYKGRMVALNTLEGTTLAGSRQFAQRARWSQNGTPFQSVAAGTVPTTLVEWLSDVKGRGGYVDAPTNERIVSADFVRDLLVVGFERSHWALRYTGNEILPFVWERINKELGSESTFSMVPFDRGILAVGGKSINSCDGNSVTRIDENIPDEVFNIHNNGGDGPLRVHGIRDFFERIVYWTFPDAGTQAKFPDRLLVFNYHNQTWAIFKDAFTAFGEFQRFNDITWADLVDQQWDEASFSWVSAKLQSQFPNIIAGNQQGFVLILNQRVNNSPALYIKSITVGAGIVSIEVLDHNLESTSPAQKGPNEYIRIDNIVGGGATELNDRVFSVERSDSNNIRLWTKPRTTITGLSQATQAIVTAVGHNFNEGQHFYIDQVAGMTEINGLDGLVVSTTLNAVTIDIDTTGFTAYTNSGAIQNLDATTIGQVVPSGTYLGCGTIERVMGFTAKSKKFNFLDVGKKTFLGHLDFLSTVTSNGEIAVDIYTDYNDSSPVNAGQDDFFNNVISTQIEQFSTLGKDKEWHRFYCPTDAQFFDYTLTLIERQMFTPSITSSDVLIDAIIVWAENGGRLVD